MRSFRNILSLLLCVLVLSTMTAAFAESPEMTAGAEEAEDVIQPHISEWEELVAEFLADHEYAEDSITLGYCNLATGEEHYLNADMYMAAGSMYKIATSMYYCDKVDSGEMTWETLVGGYQIQRAIEQIIVNSDNNIAQILWKNVGSWKTYRTATAPYFGVDPETVEQDYFKENYLIPRQIITELRQVYDNIDGKYQKIYEFMAKAEPQKYFKNHEQKYEMGHKYGWIERDGYLFINDCAIIYATEPIAIVMFTKGVSKPLGALADYCTAAYEFCDEMAAADELAAQELAKAQAETTPEPTPTAETVTVQPEVSMEIAQTEKVISQPMEAAEEIDLMVIIIGAVTLLGIIAVIVISVKKKMNAAWGLIAVLLFALGLFLCTSANKVGLLYCAPSGDPADTVRIFMDSVISGDYSTAYGCVENYSSLGLENSPDSEAGELIYRALRESYSYSFDGSCETDKLASEAKVRFTYLDTKAMAADLASEAETVLPELVKEKNDDQVYDSDKNYRESFTDEVYLTALKTVLSQADRYYTTKELTFELSYFNGGWHIELSNDIINAISGGTAY